MGQAFDRGGEVLGEARGDTKREVFDKLMEAHPDAEEIRIRSVEEKLAAVEDKHALVERIASVCHEANRQYCQSLGDFSQKAWLYADEWQRASAIAGVMALMANPLLTSEQTHLLWLAQKVKDGWVYGPVKDADLKTHPCMQPYDMLPEEQRRKDALFGNIVRALAFNLS